MNNYGRSIIILILTMIFSTGLSFAEFAGGIGTSADPFLVSNADQLNEIRNYEGAEHVDKYFKQTANIDLSPAALTGKTWYNATEGWKPIGNGDSFCGSYDGDGYKITGLTINRTNDYQGLFGWIKQARVKNVKILEVNIQAQGSIGAFGGYLEESIVYNCSVSGDVTSSNSYASGGFAGYICSSTDLKDCSAAVNVTGDTSVGGFAGYSEDSAFDSCYASGSATGTSETGGFIGYIINSEISNSNSEVAVTGTNNSTGGFAGYSEDSAFDSCYASGSTTGTSETGGFVGYIINSEISNSYSEGVVKGTNNSVGGFAGNCESSVVDSCYAAGSATGTSEVGGFAGYANMVTIIDSFSTGSVECALNSAGGFIGSGNGTIKSCYASGNVSGSSETGGFCGYLTGPIYDCYSTGAVSGDQTVGGFGGMIFGSNLYNCYSTGAVSGNTDVGGFCGYNSLAFGFKCYWDKDTSGQASSAMAGSGTVMGRTTVQMKYPYEEGTNVYTDWTFPGTWIHDEGASVNSGYPFLATSFKPKAFKAENEGDKNVLTWFNTTMSGYNGVVIRSSTNTYPETREDGTLVYEGAVSDEITDSKNHTGITSGELYYYSIWSYFTFTDGEEKTVYVGPVKTVCYAGSVNRKVLEKAIRDMKAKKIDADILNIYAENYID